MLNADFFPSNRRAIEVEAVGFALLQFSPTPGGILLDEPLVIEDQLDEPLDQPLDQDAPVDAIATFRSGSDGSNRKLVTETTRAEFKSSTFEIQGDQASAAATQLVSLMAISSALVAVMLL